MSASTKSVFDLLSRARRRGAAMTGPMTVLAFTDPNDLLSYRIVPAHFPGDSSDQADKPLPSVASLVGGTCGSW